MSVSDFGVLKRMELRQAWPNEAVDFTPWLAENLQALGDVLGLQLELRGKEMPVGPFSLDILAHDLNRNRPVIIENQLRNTDHDHLGKLLTYAAGYDASIVIWIAREFREEHRQALDWLNRHTDDNPDNNVEFFGVVIELWQIDDSRPAYNFKLVASPNDWTKNKLHTVSSNPSSVEGELCRAFFQDVVERLRDHHSPANKARIGTSQFYYFPSGIPGILYGMGFPKRQGFRVELYIWMEDEGREKIFDVLQAEKEVLESELEAHLEWERQVGKTACRIAVYRSGNITDDQPTLEEIKRWAIEHIQKFKQVFGPRLQQLAASMGNGPEQSFPVKQPPTNGA